jgi:hypothetical protein
MTGKEIYAPGSDVKKASALLADVSKAAYPKVPTIGSEWLPSQDKSGRWEVRTELSTSMSA